MKRILKIMFFTLLVTAFIIGSYTIFSVNGFATKVETPDPHPGSKWAEACCGSICAYDYCAGVGTWNCCL